MTTIGITGGIGSGKSYVCQALQQQGYPVYDSDSRAKTIMAQNKTVRAGLIDLFGETVFHNDLLDRAMIASIVFTQPELLHRLNALVHPAVIEDARLWVQKQIGNCCFIESALLYPGGLDAICDRIVIVNAPEKTRIERILRRDFDGVNTEQNRQHILDRIRAQATYYQPDKPADLILNGDGSIPITERIEQILKLVKL